MDTINGHWTAAYLILHRNLKLHTLYYRKFHFLLLCITGGKKKQQQTPWAHYILEPEKTVMQGVHLAFQLRMDLPWWSVSVTTAAMHSALEAVQSLCPNSFNNTNIYFSKHSAGSSFRFTILCNLNRALWYQQGHWCHVPMTWSSERWHTSSSSTVGSGDSQREEDTVHFFSPRRLLIWLYSLRTLAPSHCSNDKLRMSVKMAQALRAGRSLRSLCKKWQRCIKRQLMTPAGKTWMGNFPSSP